MQELGSLTQYPPFRGAKNVRVASSIDPIAYRACAYRACAGR